MTIRSMSEKRRAKLAAEGNPFPSSTITKKTPKQKTWKRSPKNAARVYGTKAHRDWMSKQACAFCRWPSTPDCPSQAAHVRNGGTGRKANWEQTVPACGPHWITTRYVMEGQPVRKLVEGCHAQFDAAKKTWREKFDTDSLAAKYAAEWLALSGETP